jgi:hypothetical protein
MQILTECVEVNIGILGRYKSGGSGKLKQYVFKYFTGTIRQW